MLRISNSQKFLFLGYLILSMLFTQGQGASNSYLDKKTISFTKNSYNYYFEVNRTTIWETVLKISLFLYPSSPPTNYSYKTGFKVWDTTDPNNTNIFPGKINGTLAPGFTLSIRQMVNECIKTPNIIGFPINFTKSNDTTAKINLSILIDSRIYDRCYDRLVPIYQVYIQFIILFAIVLVALLVIFYNLRKSAIKRSELYSKK